MAYGASFFHRAVVIVTQRTFFSALLCGVLLGACGGAEEGRAVWNNPYSFDAGEGERRGATLYSSFITRPRFLDPAKSYTEDEFVFLSQIYEPPLQYHYLKRPYVLRPATLAKMPTVRFFDAQGRALPENAPAEAVAESVYELTLTPGRLYQPHPAFARDKGGRALYLDLSSAALADKYGVGDFPETGAREVRAADYIYQLKRLAHPRLHSPIFGMMAEKIVGLKELAEALRAEDRARPGAWLDLDRYALSGATALDDYTWQVRVKGRYPQFLYWLALPFFAPMPREADRFFNQPGMAEKNITLDWWPVGSGAFMLTENNPNRRMVLRRNPNFAGETYPCEGAEGDAESGLLADCGKPLPFLDTVIFTREKEAIPYWNKFLQGYYDASGIASDNFDQAVRIDAAGGAALSDDMRARGIRLMTSARLSTFYLGFNLSDPVVGGLDEAACKLRQAISIALDQEEFISIFLNGRGTPAMSPLPPGVFGFEAGEAGMNPYVYDWKDGAPKRKSLAEAKRLLAEAGWPRGRRAQSGEPLVLYLDTTAEGMGSKPHLDWLTRQLKKIDIQLSARVTDYNRLQDKLKKGAFQLFFLGWNADYPDPENFFFLLAGSEGQMKYGGENHANYENPEFDRLFSRMKAMDNTAERLEIIRQMRRLAQHDAPWVYAFHPQTYTLTHSWLKNKKPGEVINNTLKYQRVRTEERARAWADWNPPRRAPFFALLGVLIFGGGVVAFLYWRRERRLGIQNADARFG